MTNHDKGSVDRRVVIPVMSVEAERLYRRLATTSPGELISYKEMEQIANADLRANRHIIYTAIRKAEREDGIVFVVERGEGYRRAKGRDFMGIVHSGIVRSRRIVKRSLRQSLRMPQSEFDALSDDDKARLNTDRTVVATLAHFSGHGVVKKLEGEVRLQNDRLTIGKVLDISK